MNPIQKNLIANYAGSSWNAVMSIVFLPLYIRFMGIEAYGLVGVFGSLMALFGVLDLGLSATMTREMARLSAADPSGRDMRNLARTLEVIYWIVAIVLGIAVLGLAGPIATQWVKPDRLSTEDVRQALMITGGVVALRWPVAFYAGGLRGLDRQPLLNLIQSTAATLKGLGAVGVLWLVSPTIQAFFTWQIMVGAAETSLLMVALWRCLPGRGTGAHLALEPVKAVWRFSAGMTGISLAVLLLTQADKIILSKMLSLEEFAYYTLAWTVAGGILLRIVDPIDSAVYPTLTRLAAKRNEQELSRVYHKSCQMQAVLLVPAAMVLIFFGDVILSVWSSDPNLVKNTAPLLSILAIGTCLNGFMRIPYLAQLAYGWTSLALYQNVVAAVVIVPLMVLLTGAYQGIGACYAWAVLNAGYVIISIHIMHRRILTCAMRDWYVYDIGSPTLAALCVTLVAGVVMPTGLPVTGLVFYVVTAAGLSFLAAILCAEFTRAMLFKTVALVLTRDAAVTKDL
jgi:O-antigen/teichoic acid export membrane protein